MRPPSSPRFVALVVASVVFSAVVLPTQGAGADTVADERAQASKIAAQIDADSQVVDSLTARFEAAQLAASDVDARVTRTTASLAGAQTRIDEARRAVRDQAVSEYIKGTRSSSAPPVFGQSNDPQHAALARFLADVSINQSQAVLDANRSAQQDYDASLKELRGEQTRAHAALASVESSRRAAEAAVERQKANLAKVQGQLASLVAAEQARQRAEREAQTRANVSQTVLPPRPPGAAPDRGSHAAPVDASRAAAAVAEARRQLGKPYQWGGSGPDSFDCSGLTAWAWRAGGVSLAHYTGAQYNATTHITIAELQPGDLVFFHSDLSHVGIYVGSGQMIHAPQTGDVVKYSSIYSEGSPIYAGRVST